MESKVKRHWGPLRTAELVAFVKKHTPADAEPNFHAIAEEAMKAGLYSMSTGMNNVRYSLMGAWFGQRKYPLAGRSHEPRMRNDDSRGHYLEYELSRLRKEKRLLDDLAAHPIQAETWRVLRAVLDKAVNESAQMFWPTISGPSA